MDRWRQKVAVVTGASAGIGLAIAKSLVQHNLTVIGLSRRVEKMKNGMNEVRGPGKFYAKACDVTDEKEVNETFAWIEQKFQTVHILVNNAGTLRMNTIEEISTADLQLIINTNIMGVLYCTRAAMKLMRKNAHEAHIVNINSGAGHRVPPLPIPMNVYSATKHALTAMSQSLIKEINGGPIRVTSISPGMVNTEIFEVGNVKTDSPQDSFNSRKMMEPEDIAASVIHAISAPPHVQIWDIILKPLGQVY